MILQQKHLKITESFKCSFLFSYLTTLISSSKINLIFINSSISTVQPGSVAADALSSGQEKDARVFHQALQNPPLSPQQSISNTLYFQGKLTNTIDTIIPSRGFAAVSVQYTRPLITQLPLALAGFW